MRFIALVSALAAIPVVAGAQPAQTFADLAGLVSLEEDITVTTEAGETIEGSALAVSPSSIHLLVDGDQVVLREPDVRWVRQRWDDPLRDGYLTGFATGAGALWGIGVVFMRLEGELPSAGEAFRMSVASGLTGLLGAWIGGTIDAESRAVREIYRRSPRVAVVPLRSGAGLSVSW